MLSYISATNIYPIETPPIKNGVIGIDGDGTILEILTAQQAKDKNIKGITYYEGALVPGFVNTHCHLELSHLRGKIAERTGLTNFIRAILSNRQQPEEEVIEAMHKADEEMYNNGIVAVGDISNLPISISIKLTSKIYYHTFVEVFGFNRPSQPIMEEALAIKRRFEPLKASVVPHAPYSVSAELFDEIKAITTDSDIQSIHNQETEAENELFLSGDGPFAVFFEELGIAQNHAHGTGIKSIQYHLPKMPKKVNTLLVHNTFVAKDDLDFSKKHHQQLYWCLCPNANLYIENALPNVALFKEEDVAITLGTDSLSSNHQLNILSEMQTLQDHLQISFGESIKWATLNGAKFLGIDQQYGSFIKGKKPGVILVELAEDGIIKKETKIKRLF